MDPGFVNNGAAVRTSCVIIRSSFHLNLIKWIVFRLGAVSPSGQLASSVYSDCLQSARALWKTPISKLTVRMNGRVFTHPHVLCQTQRFGGGWLDFFFFMVSVIYFGRFLAFPQPPHTGSSIKIVQMDLD